MLNILVVLSNNIQTEAQCKFSFDIKLTFLLYKIKLYSWEPNHRKQGQTCVRIKYCCSKDDLCSQNCTNQDQMSNEWTGSALPGSPPSKNIKLMII